MVNQAISLKIIEEQKHVPFLNNMLAITGQTAGPIWLNFSGEPMGTQGIAYAKKI